MDNSRPQKISKTEQDDDRNPTTSCQSRLRQSEPGPYLSALYIRSQQSYQRRTIKELLKQRRVWWFTEHGSKYLNKEHGGLDFTVMNYNLLSQKLLEDHPFLYSQCKPEHLNWEYRSQNILREIEEHLCDILCFQEVEEKQFHEVFQPHLEKFGYSSLYKKKTSAKCDGCAIFFKNTRFELETHVDVEYRKNNMKVLNRDNVGIVALLKPKLNTLKNVRLCVATTHLLFNPKRGDVKLSQLRVLLAEIEKLAFKACINDVPIYHPVILCGDLNSEPFSPLYDFIVKGIIQYDKLMAVEVSGQHKKFTPGRPMTDAAVSLKDIGINCETRYEETSNRKSHRICAPIFNFGDPHFKRKPSGPSTFLAKIRKEKSLSTGPSDISGASTTGVQHKPAFGLYLPSDSSGPSSSNTCGTSGSSGASSSDIQHKQVFGPFAVSDHSRVSSSDMQNKQVFAPFLLSGNSRVSFADLQNRRIFGPFLPSGGSGASSSNITGASTSNITGASSSNITGASASNITGASSSNITGASSSNITGSSSSNITRASSSNITGRSSSNITGASSSNITGASSSVVNDECGCFIHHLNFVSAYQHVRTDGRKEITTQNENTKCTVDYIFYSVSDEELFKAFSRRCKKTLLEGKLRHLSCYGLLHYPDFKDLCNLPNAYLSSDHICLISRFVLLA